MISSAAALTVSKSQKLEKHRAIYSLKSGGVNKKLLFLSFDLLRADFKYIFQKPHSNVNLKSKCVWLGAVSDKLIINYKN